MHCIASICSHLQSPRMHVQQWGLHSAHASFSHDTSQLMPGPLGSTILAVPDPSSLLCRSGRPTMYNQPPSRPPCSTAASCSILVSGRLTGCLGLLLVVGSHHWPAPRGFGNPPGPDAGPHAVPPGAAAWQHSSAASRRIWSRCTTACVYSFRSTTIQQLCA